MPTRALLAPDATTRTAHALRPSHRPELFLSTAEVVTSPETGLRYRIERLLGEGGFGQVYLARPAGSIGRGAEPGLYHVSASIDGWLRERISVSSSTVIRGRSAFFDKFRCSGAHSEIQHAPLRADARIRAART